MTDYLITCVNRSGSDPEHHHIAEVGIRPRTGARAEWFQSRSSANRSSWGSITTSRRMPQGIWSR